MESDLELNIECDKEQIKELLLFLKNYKEGNKKYKYWLDDLQVEMKKKTGKSESFVFWWDRLEKGLDELLEKFDGYISNKKKQTVLFRISSSPDGELLYLDRISFFDDIVKQFPNMDFDGYIWYTDEYMQTSLSCDYKNGKLDIKYSPPTIEEDEYDDYCDEDEE